MSWQMSNDSSSFYSDILSDQLSNSIVSQLSDETLQPNINSFYETKHRTSVSSCSSGSSVCGPPSPVISTLRRQSTTLTCPPSELDEESGDEPWNLVAYHIPWGPGYEGYEAGTLPGPDGTCIFLRSPTPLKRQRTVQACDKCRERKAKCSGARPTCGRCSERGFMCVYTSSNQTTGENPGSPTLHRKLSYSSSREQLKTSIKNRIRRKSSQTEPTSLYNTAHHVFPRRHSQPASAAPIPGSIAPQLHIEEEQLDMNTFRYPQPQEAGEANPQELDDAIRTNDYSLSRGPMNLYARSTVNLDAYRFPPPCIETTHNPNVDFTPLAGVNLGPIYHVDNGLSIQMAPPISSETLWRIPEYYPQLEPKPTHHAFTDLDVFQPVYVDANYPAHRSIDVEVSEPHVPEPSLGGPVQFSYLQDYGTFGS